MRHTLTFALLTALLINAGCGPRGREEARAVQTVRVVPVRRATVTRTTNLIGTVVGDRQAAAMTKSPGRVTNIARPEGSPVAENEPILYVINDIPGMDYQPAPVRAPVAGVVGKVYVEVGQTVGPGTPVAMIVDYSARVRIQASVSDADLQHVRVGAAGAIAVPAWPDTTFTGRVTRVTPMLDQLSRTATVELIVDNPGRRLIPGMSASIRLVLEELAEVIVVPLTALFPDGEPRIAVVIDSVIEMRTVEPGLRGDRLAELRSGVREGEAVVTTGKERIGDGDRVRPVGDAQQ